MLLKCWLDMKIGYYRKLVIILNNLGDSCSYQVDLKTTISWDMKKNLCPVFIKTQYMTLTGTDIIDNGLSRY